MSERIHNLLAAASLANSAASDMIDAVHDGDVIAMGNVDAGKTSTALANALWIVLEAIPSAGEDETQLQGALERYLENRT